MEALSSQVGMGEFGPKSPGPIKSRQCSSSNPISLAPKSPPFAAGFSPQRRGRARVREIVCGNLSTKGNTTTLKSCRSQSFLLLGFTFTACLPSSRICIVFDSPLPAFVRISALDHSFVEVGSNLRPSIQVADTSALARAFHLVSTNRPNSPLGMSCKPFQCVCHAWPAHPSCLHL